MRSRSTIEFKSCRDAGGAFLAGISRSESVERLPAAMPTIMSLSPLRQDEWTTRPDDLMVLVEIDEAS